MRGCCEKLIFCRRTSTSTRIKTHSDVVRPHAAEQQASLVVNPYHLGFSLWEAIVAGARSRARVRDSRRGRRLRLHPQLPLRGTCRRAQAVPLRGERRRQRAGAQDHDIHALRETVLAPKYNFGAPAVLVKHIASDGSLDLVHEHATDGRGLDVDKRGTRPRLHPQDVAPADPPRDGGWRRTQQDDRSRVTRRR